MKQYSFIVYAPTEVSLVEDGIALSLGRNVFTIVIKDLGALLVRLEREGVQVIELHRIEMQPTTPCDLLLESQTPAVLNRA